MSHRPIHLVVVLAVASALGLASCGLVGSSARASEGRLQVVGGQVAVPPNPDQAAARFLIQNATGVDDELVSVTSPDADAVAIHRSEVDAAGRATMTEISSLAIPARSEVTFEPGGLHVMLTGLHHRLRAGDTLSLTLRFAEAGTRTVRLDVVDPAQMAIDPGTDMHMEGEHDHGG
ncbi:MAG: copper chaperone PCu(A)C [Actinobacteria bacterium]|nr:copper chaperone PCu(A)C [Actinomycetota bacterium]